MSLSAGREVGPAQPVRGLFLIVPPGRDVATERVERALATAAVIGVLLPQEGAAAAEVRALCRAAGVAAFSPTLEAADRLEADGVLLEGAAGVGAARRSLGAGRLIGARARVSRHEAMLAGEAGADFIAFGDDDHAVSERLVDTLAWWSELFVLPSLALAAAIDDEGARRLGVAGADFLGVRLDRLGDESRAVLSLARAFGVGADA